MSNKQQRVAIVTGASQGIGAGVIKALRERNYSVIATSRQNANAQSRHACLVGGTASGMGSQAPVPYAYACLLIPFMLPYAVT